MLKKILGLIGLCLTLTACGQGGGGGSTSSSGAGSTSSSTPASGTTGTTTTTPPAPLSNFATITVDGGPAALGVGPNAYIAANTPYVSVILCAPGSTTNCQTVDHVLVDNGSVGLRIFASVINASLLSALPLETDPNSNPVGSCYGFVDGYMFGSVRQADFQVGGETVANMPFMAVADAGVFSTVPGSCSSGGGSNLNGVQAFGANGVMGIGVTPTDCGAACTRAGGSGAATYYDCPNTGCGAIVSRISSASAPFQQLPNPVAAMSVDNNGTIISLPAAPNAGQATMTGTLYFGIGTQTNNSLGSATVLANSSAGVGLLTATYNGVSLNESFLDSGTNLYFFVDRTIATCTQSQLQGYYCPTTPETLSPTLQSQNGASVSAAFTLNNAQMLASSNFAVLPGIGANPNLVGVLSAYPHSFDFGLPFFYGRNVYTAIEGRSAGGFTGPYFAY
ncbi:MAG TPA: DUF3443 family protein [Rhizomicrobium sp.]|nr:DUF3443 family protein [Rhizomicrobium sp.]